MATYNGEKYIREQLESIAKQDEVDITIFASDHFSQDNTPAIVKNFCLNNDIKLELTSPPIGAPKTSHSNFFHLILQRRYENFDYICFCDQDDIWMPSKIKQAIKKICETNAAGYSSSTTALYPSGKKKFIFNSNRQTSADFLYESAGQGCTYVMKSANFMSWQNFLRSQPELVENATYHDWMTYAYFRCRNYKWVIDSRSFIFYRQHSSNVLGARSGAKAYIKRLLLLTSKTYAGQLLAARNLAERALGKDSQVLLLTPKQNLRAKVLQVSKAFEFRRSKLQSLVVALWCIVHSSYRV